VKVTALTPPAVKDARQLGFLADTMLVPEDFDAMASHEIAALFSAP
jgi:hypothetical protein